MFKKILNCLSVITPVVLAGMIVFSFTVTIFGSAQNLVPGGEVICPGGNCPLIGSNYNALRQADQNTVVRFLINVARFLTFISVGLSVLFMVYGGLRFIVAGNSEGSEAGKKTLKNATIGLVVSIVAFTAVTIISNILQGNIAGNFLSGR